MGSFNYEQGRSANGFNTRPMLNGQDRVERLADYSKHDLDRLRQNVAMPSNYLLQKLPSATLKKLGPFMRKVAFAGGEFEAIRRRKSCSAFSLARGSGGFGGSGSKRDFQNENGRIFSFRFCQASSLKSSRR